MRQRRKIFSPFPFSARRLFLSRDPPDLLHHLIQTPYRIQNFFMIAVACDTNIRPGDCTALERREGEEELPRFLGNEFDHLFVVFVDVSFSPLENVPIFPPISAAAGTTSHRGRRHENPKF